MRNRTSTIRHHLLAGMISLVLVSLSIWATLWVHDEYSAFKTESDSLREKYLQTQQEQLRSQVANVVDTVRHLKTHAETRLKSSLKKRVDEACDIATNLYHQNRHTRTDAEIRKIIKDTLRLVPFDKGGGRIFAFNLDGVEELFADQPEMERESPSAVTEARSDPVVSALLDLVRVGGEGFHEYTRTNPNGVETDQDKIAFVKLFEPLGWVIGAGEDVDDFTNQMQGEVLDVLVHLRFGREGYFFGSTFQGGSLFSNGKDTREEGSIWDLTDPNGVKVIQEQRRAADQPGGGFVSYSWAKLESAVPAPKLSYVVGMPEWQWIIGAGVYLDTIDGEIARKRETLRQHLVARIQKSAVILLTLVVLIFFWVRYLSNRIDSGIKTLSWFFERAAAQSIIIDPGGLPFKEFEQIALLANKLVEDRREAEKALRESEERLRLALEGGELGTWNWNIQTGRVDFNHRWAEMLGYPPEEIEPHVRSWEGLLHPDDAARTLLAVNEHLSGKTPGYETEHRLRHKSGDWVWVLDKGRVIERDVAGNPLRASGTHLDITERKRAEKVLQRTLQRFFTILSNLYAGILLVQDDGSVEFVNQAFCNLFNLSDSTETLRGLDASELTERIRGVYAHPREAVARFQGIIVRGEPVRGEEVPMQGEKTYLRDFIPIVTDGIMLGRLWHYQDITDRKRAEEERLRLEQQVQQAQKRASLLTMAGAIAHHFNNLLSVVLGNLELAGEDLPPGSAAATGLLEAEKAAGRAAELSRLMLTYVGQGVRHRTSLDLAATIQGLLPTIHTALPGNVRIETDLPAGCPLVMLDPVEVEQVVMNLLSNGWEAMGEEEGVVRIVVRPARDDELLAGRSPASAIQGTGPWVCLEATDTGQGMDQEIQNRMFDPFFTTKFTGRGLGLAVTLGIVQACDGAIAVESRPGGGTTVRVFFMAEKPGDRVGG